MKLKALAEETGTPVSTVKFYLREGLVPPGEKLNATTSAYGRRHVERLRLIAVLRQVVGLGLVEVRRVVEAVDTLDPLHLMGTVQAVVLGLPDPPEGEATGDGTRPASGTDRVSAGQVMDAMDWSGGLPGAVVALDRQLETMAAWGLAPDLDQVLVYARAVDAVAENELVRGAPWSSGPAAEAPSNDVVATYTAVGIHAYSQLLQRLHAVAQGSHARGLGAQMGPGEGI